MDMEQEIKAAKADVAPRVTKDDIEAAIAEEVYFTAQQGRHGHSHLNYGFVYEAPVDAHLKLLTFCVLVLKNGFTVTGTSACASPENFNVDIGYRVAREDAVRQVWTLLGYALKERLSGSSASVGQHVWQIPPDMCMVRVGYRNAIDNTVQFEDVLVHRSKAEQSPHGLSTRLSMEHLGAVPKDYGERARMERQELNTRLEDLREHLKLLSDRIAHFPA